MPEAAEPTPTAAVGFVGLGNMGRPMAARLVGAGHDVVGTDPSTAARELATADGVRALASATDVARTAGTVFLMLPNSDVVEAVVDDLLGVPADERACRILVDMSSSEPARTVALAQRLAEHGLELLDAPVSGGVVGAVAGELTIMVGATEDQMARVEPLLAPMGKRVVRTGATGSGHAVKALNNLMSAAHLLVTDEAMVVAARFGIDPEVVLSVVNTSSGRSGSSELKLPRYVLSRTFDSGFASSLLEKDVRIATSLAHELGVDARLADAVLARWSELNDELPAGADHTEIVRPLEQRAGVELRAAD